MADGGCGHQRAHEDQPDEFVGALPVGGVDDQPRHDHVDEVVDDAVELGAEPVAGPGQPGHGAVGQVAAEVPDEDGVARPVQLPGHHVVDGHDPAQEIHQGEHVLQPEVPEARGSPGRRRHSPRRYPRRTIPKRTHRRW